MLLNFQKSMGVHQVEEFVAEGFNFERVLDSLAAAPARCWFCGAIGPACVPSTVMEETTRASREFPRGVPPV
jgi:hypothetical protein